VPFDVAIVLKVISRVCWTLSVRDRSREGVGQLTSVEFGALGLRWCQVFGRLAVSIGNFVLLVWKCKNMKHEAWRAEHGRLAQCFET